MRKAAKALITLMSAAALLLLSITSVAEPTVVSDRTNGVWQYSDDTLTVKINRYEEDNPALTYFVTEIITCEERPLTTFFPERDTKISGKALDDPRDIADYNGCVVAFTDDFFSNRIINKNTVGIVLRSTDDGEKVFSKKTFKNADGKGRFPTLDVMALFNDGTMKTFVSNEHTPEEYMEMGVTDTYAFGPILISNGEIDERLLPGSTRFSENKDPRCALGYIEPYHYIVLTVRGRASDSKGVSVHWLAEKMQELGATEALNLDGGNTTALIFMGDLINRPINVSSKDIRDVSTLIGVK